jgi:hypothetical protein
MPSRDVLSQLQVRWHGVLNSDYKQRKTTEASTPALRHGSHGSEAILGKGVSLVEADAGELTCWLARIGGALAV